MFIEIRFHGRGGQGAVTSAEILAKAAVLEGRYAQAFPSFGAERTGAPVKSFCRISDRPITIRSQIYRPDYAIVFDSSLAALPEVREGLKENSVIILNSEKPDFDNGLKNKAFAFDATRSAMKILGRNIVSTAMLGVLAKATCLVGLDSLLKVLDEKFEGKIAELNKQLVREAYENTKI
jgi:pyruvate ferredoxin oxidoreductase gamma subunit